MRCEISHRNKSDKEGKIPDPQFHSPSSLLLLRLDFLRLRLEPLGFGPNFASLGFQSLFLSTEYFSLRTETPRLSSQPLFLSLDPLSFDSYFAGLSPQPLFLDRDPPRLRVYLDRIRRRLLLIRPRPICLLVDLIDLDLHLLLPLFGPDGLHRSSRSLHRSWSPASAASLLVWASCCLERA